MSAINLAHICKVGGHDYCLYRRKLRRAISSREVLDSLAEQLFILKIHIKWIHCMTQDTP